MILRIYAVTDIGRDAIKKLDGEKTMGVCKKKTVCEKPLTIEIEIRGVGRFWQLLKNNPHLHVMVTSTWASVMQKYGATTKDYKMEVV